MLITDITTSPPLVRKRARTTTVAARFVLDDSDDDGDDANPNNNQEDSDDSPIEITRRAAPAHTTHTTKPHTTKPSGTHPADAIDLTDTTPPPPVTAAPHTNNDIHTRSNIHTRSDDEDDDRSQTVDRVDHDDSEEDVDQEEDEEDAALVQCEEVAQRLKQALGHVLDDDGRCALLDTDELGGQDGGALGGPRGGGPRGGLATQEEVVQACGGAAAVLKPYQLVGINFMLLHARTGAGGLILAVCEGGGGIKPSPHIVLGLWWGMCSMVLCLLLVCSLLLHSCFYHSSHCTF